MFTTGILVLAIGLVLRGESAVWIPSVRLQQTCMTMQGDMDRLRRTTEEKCVTTEGRR